MLLYKSLTDICIFFSHMLYSSHMPKFLSFFLKNLLILISFLSISPMLYAWNLWMGNLDTWEIRYCNGSGCTLSGWSIAVGGAVGNLFSQKTISTFASDVVLYFLWFVSLVAVLYVMYAWVQIMTWGGDEEKVKKARQTIIYVFAGIVLIWVAYWIVSLIVWVLR